MSLNSTNVWDKGSYHYMFWSFYTILNYLGVILCGLVMAAILRLGKQGWKSNDIFVFFLCLGCFCMSAACATQCLLNAAKQDGNFAWGNTACQMEAFFHVSSIMLQFFSIMLVAINSYFLVVKEII